MADILIKGMDIPQSCVDCSLVANEGYCCVTQKTLYGDWGHVRQEWCPLVELPPEENRLYVCDPSKADGCSKTGCAYAGGEKRGDCMLTTRLEWALMDVERDG